MAGKKLSGTTIYATPFKKWFLSGHTNASYEREQEILNGFYGLTWIRKKAGENPYLVTDRINQEYPYYWAATREGKHSTRTIWQVYMEPPSMGSEDIEKLTMRELVDGNSSWSLGIFPGEAQHESINWDTILYSGIYRLQHP